MRKLLHDINSVEYEVTVMVFNPNSLAPFSNLRSNSAFESFLRFQEVRGKFFGGRVALSGGFLEHNEVDVEVDISAAELSS